MPKILKLISNKDPLPAPTQIEPVYRVGADANVPTHVVEQPEKFKWVQYIVAIVLAIAYLGSIAFLNFKADTTDATYWERLLHLFRGVETVGFAAIGFILGTEIQRRGSLADVSSAKNKALEAEAKSEALETQLNQIRGRC